MQRFAERSERNKDFIMSCFQYLNEQRRRMSSSVELMKWIRRTFRRNKVRWTEENHEESSTQEIKLRHGIHWNRQRGSDLVVGKVSTPFQNIMDVVQTTKEGPIASRTGMFGDGNDSWKETKEAEGQENNKIPEHVL